MDGRPFVMASLPKPAAVLVPIVMHADEPTVLLTERASNLRDHSGQIAFPAARSTPTIPRRSTPRCARPTRRSGSTGALVRPLGYLDSYLSSSGYIVFPVVGAGHAALRRSPSTAHEVADAFEVPLSFLMDPANHEIHAREWKGRIRQYYAMPFGDRYIWGVTAGILRNLYVRLYES